MSEIEKIKRYIALTGIKVHGQDRYAMNMREVRELMRSGEGASLEIIRKTAHDLITGIDAAMGSERGRKTA